LNSVLLQRARQVIFHCLLCIVKKGRRGVNRLGSNLLEKEGWVGVS